MNSIEVKPTVTLDPYQVESVRWLLQHPFACVFLDPGLGKTVIILMAFWLLKRAKLIDCLLVVAPLDPCYLVWPEEVKKWNFPFTVEVLHGPDKDKAVERKADIYVINYEGLEWLHPHIEQLRTQRGRIWLVPDEITKVKHQSSLRHRMLESMVECFGRRAGLTGTPLPNGYIDLHGQLKIIDRGKRLGLFLSHYRTMYFSPVNAGNLDLMLGAKTDEERRARLRDAKKKHAIVKWVPTKKGTKAIDEALRDICIRFSDAELGLKAVRTNVIKVRLPEKARKAYETLESDFTLAFEDAGHVLAPNAGSLGIKLRQVANGGVIVDNGSIVELHTAKADALTGLVDELQGSPLLCGYEFTADKDRYVKALEAAGHEVATIHGKMDRETRLSNLREFNEGNIQCLLCQYQTISFGLNLQKNCHHVCMAGMIWDLDLVIQFMKRVHRKGQTRQVVLHQLVAVDTRDEVVMAAVHGKDRTQQRFLKLLEEYRKYG